MTDPNSVNDLTERVVDFANRRDWAQFHDPKNLAMALAAEVGELNALLRWVRNTESDAAVAIEPLRERLQAEVGDVGILLLALCARSNVDFGEAIIHKLNINADRYPEADARAKAERPQR